MFCDRVPRIFRQQKSLEIAWFQGFLMAGAERLELSARGFGATVEITETRMVTRFSVIFIDALKFDNSLNQAIFQNHIEKEPRAALNK